jgi:hypothetical protein
MNKSNPENPNDIVVTQKQINSLKDAIFKYENPDVKDLPNYNYLVEFDKMLDNIVFFNKMNIIDMFVFQKKSLKTSLLQEMIFQIQQVEINDEIIKLNFFLELENKIKNYLTILLAANKNLKDTIDRCSIVLLKNASLLALREDTSINQEHQSFKTWVQEMKKASEFFHKIFDSFISRNNLKEDNVTIQVISQMKYECSIFKNNTIKMYSFIVFLEKLIWNKDNNIYRILGCNIVEINPLPLIFKTKEDFDFYISLFENKIFDKKNVEISYTYHRMVDHGKIYSEISEKYFQDKIMEKLEFFFDRIKQFKHVNNKNRQSIFDMAYNQYYN